MAELESIPLLAEAGTGGVKRYGGIVDDEWNPRLSGTRANQVYREMHDNSGLLGGAVRAIQFLIRQAPWMLEPRNGGNSPEHMYWRDRTRDALFDDLKSTWSEVIMSMTSVIPYGWACLWQSWKICRGDHPSKHFNSQHDDGLWMPRDLEIRAQDTLHQWLYDEDDTEVIGWQQMAPPRYKLQDLAATRYLHFRIDPDRGNPQGRSMYRNAYRDYYFVKRLEDIRGVGEERNLAGLPVIYVPTNVMHPNADSAHAAIRTQMETKVQKIRRDQLEGLVFPCAEENGKKTGYGLELLSSGGRDRGSINEAISDHRWGMMVSLLAQFFLLGAQKLGSFALSSSFTDLFAVAIGAIMDMSCDVLNRQCIPRMMVLNQVPREFWPGLQHGDIESEDAAKIITAFTQAAQQQIVTPTDDDEIHARRILSWPQRRGDAQPRARMMADAWSQAVSPYTGQVNDGLQPPTVDPEPPKEEQVALTVEEAALRLNMSPLQVMAAIRGGRLPGRRIGAGGGYRILPDHLEAFMGGGVS